LTILSIFSYLYDSENFLAQKLIVLIMPEFMGSEVVGSNPLRVNCFLGTLEGKASLFWALLVIFWSRQIYFH